MPRQGENTWLFSTLPSIIARATSSGKEETAGPLGDLFDFRHNDDREGHDTWEHAEQAMLAEAANGVLVKAKMTADQVDLLIGADLNAQLSSFYFGLRSFSAPALGIYSACASICEALAFACLCIDSGMATVVLVGTSSHNSTAERQFRYPTEYGTQKPPTAQRTVTGAGVALVGRSETSICIPAATIGSVIDFGITSPWEMGAAMAPAACSTIVQHLKDTGKTIEDFDCIATGDLGDIGHNILLELLQMENIYPGNKLLDCGMLIFNQHQPEVFSGGSGGACCSLVSFGHFLKKLENGEWNRVLVCATGALLSSITVQQGDSIPCISHAICFERRGGKE